MTPELQKYYEDRFSMMATPGWKDLMEDVAEMLKASDTLAGATVDNLEFKKGEVSMMKWMLSLKAVSEESYKELQDEADA